MEIISRIGLCCTKFLGKEDKISKANGSVAIKIEMVNGAFFIYWRVNLPGKGLIDGCNMVDEQARI